MLVVAVGNAYSVLSDSGHRNQYDRYGEDGLKGQSASAAPEVSPDDLFRMFFGDNFAFNDDSKCEPVKPVLDYLLYLLLCRVRVHSWWKCVYV